MARALKIAAALLCLICVLALCIAPWVDPPETTLKALLVILFLMSTFAVCAFWIAGTLPPGSQDSDSPAPLAATPAFGLLRLTETKCVHRC